MRRTTPALFIVVLFSKRPIFGSENDDRALARQTRNSPQKKKTCYDNSIFRGFVESLIRRRIFVGFFFFFDYESSRAFEQYLRVQARIKSVMGSGFWPIRTAAFDDTARKINDVFFCSSSNNLISIMYIFV